MENDGSVIELSMKIQKILKRWKKEARTTRVIQYRYRKGMLTVYSSQPGWLIGKGGVLVDKYREILEKEVYDFKDLEFVETEYYLV